MHFEGITLSAIVQELKREIGGGVVRQIHQPLDDVLLLKLYPPGQRRLLISTGREARIHLTEHRYGNPPTPPPFCMLLRKHLRGGVLESIEQPGLERMVDLIISRRDGKCTLRVELISPRGNVVLLRDDRVLGALHPWSRGRTLRPHARYDPPPPQGKLDPYALDAKGLARALLLSLDQPLMRALLVTLDGIGPRTAQELGTRAGLDPEAVVSSLDSGDLAHLWEAIRSFFARLKAGALEPCVYLRDGKPADCTPFPYESYAELETERRAHLSEALDACFEGQSLEPARRLSQRLARLLKDEMERVERALGHVEEDLERSQRCEEYKEYGDLLLAHLHEVEKGQKRVELEDFLKGGRRAVHLDPTLAPAENAQKFYQRYKKLKRGAAKLTQRRRELLWEQDYLRELQVHLEGAVTLEELRELEGELESEGYLSPTDRKRATSHEKASGPRRYPIDGYTIYVGRSGLQNDALVRRAHPEDLWLHAKDRPGAHVIVKGDRKGAVPEPVLRRAAELAAYHSKGRGSTKVPVTYTPVKYLKKPKGARPGLVIVTQEQGTLLVAPKGAPDA